MAGPEVFEKNGNARVPFQDKITSLARIFSKLKKPSSNAEFEDCFSSNACLSKFGFLNLEV